MKKILLVENDAFLINVYASQLRRSGYSTSIATGTAVAISRIKKMNPDLLILDANLSKSDGLSILEMIREDAGLKELKVVMLSNFNQEEKDDDYFNSAILGYFSKSENTAEEIVEGIKRLLS